jgi:hypothetical protein
VDIGRWIDRFRGAFESGTDVLIFGLVVGGAVFFLGYLVADGMYHRVKWRRLQRQCAEANESARAAKEP